MRIKREQAGRIKREREGRVLRDGHDGDPVAVRQPDRACRHQAAARSRDVRDGWVREDGLARAVCAPEELVVSDMARAFEYHDFEYRAGGDGQHAARLLGFQAYTPAR